MMTQKDKIKLRHFIKFLALKQTHYQEMLKRPFWHKYLGVNELEAQNVAHNDWNARKKKKLKPNGGSNG